MSQHAIICFHAAFHCFFFNNNNIVMTIMVLTLIVIGSPCKCGPSRNPLTRFAAHFLHANAFVSTVDLQGSLAVPATNLPINSF